MRKGTILALITILVLTGCGKANAQSSQSMENMPGMNQPTSAQPMQDVSSKGTPLAAGLLQPVDPAFWHKVSGYTVRDENGKSVSLPKDRPVFFFATWCDHCHAALQDLQSLGELNDMYFVSMYFRPDSSGTVQIKNAVDATDQTLKSLGVTIPKGHIYYALPNDPINTGMVKGVPALIEHTDEGWYVMNGEPSDSKDWKTVLQYAHS